MGSDPILFEGSDPFRVKNQGALPFGWCFSIPRQNLACRAARHLFVQLGQFPRHHDRDLSHHRLDGPNGFHQPIRRFKADDRPLLLDQPTKPFLQRLRLAWWEPLES